MYSCGGSSAAANKMAEEMCAAMDKYQEGDVASMMEAANAMMEITKKDILEMTENQSEDVRDVIKIALGFYYEM